jgi:hypothetical protein
MNILFDIYILCVPGGRGPSAGRIAIYRSGIDNSQGGLMKRECSAPSWFHPLCGERDSEPVTFFFFGDKGEPVNGMDKEQRYPILVDFGAAPRGAGAGAKPGREPSSLTGPSGNGTGREISVKDIGNLEQASGKAIDHALITIEEISRRVGGLQERMPTEFSQVVVEFGLTLDMESGALIAKVGAEASITVSLTWMRPEEKPSKG